MAGPTLERVSLLHVCKVTFDRTAAAGNRPATPSTTTQGRSEYSSLSSQDPDRYWYLKDPRWLGARPRQLGWNPLADLPSLFPNLSRLEIALTQLTGPMLLRLVYQTQLSVLILTQVG